PAPQGIVGVFTIPRIDPAELCARRHRTILVCENVADPGNLGMLLRSALAFGFRLVVTVGTTAEPFAPKVVRSSAGAVFGVRIAAADCDTLARLVASEGITLLAAGRGGTQTLSESLRPDPAARYALAVGSEAEGLSDRMRALAACTVRVAHAPEVESLNAAVAGSILMKGIYDSLS
ncbi:MAG TPA: RNA methyltransferase, partial [candidate division Zixibacteria bacterium]|nr:RNA methyltransferase [candidate division Zixibacteria bacterium]